MPERETTMSRPDAESRAFFESVLPDDPRVKARPMFGNVAGFVNGNMFMDLHGDDLFLRLSEEDRAGLLGEDGASQFEPLKGRPMKEYFLVPKAWREEPDKLGTWMERSLSWVSDMPEKKAKKRKK